MTQEEQKEKIIRVDEDAHRKAKLDAVREGKTLKEYVSDLILGKKKKPEKKETGKGK